MTEVLTSPTQEAAPGPLIDAATPDLYRINPFRLSGLPVEATARDVDRHLRLLKILEKRPDGAGHAGPLPLDPPPTPDDVRAALHDLRDPERRIVHEFFWFWPDEAGRAADDEALALLAAGDIDAATGLWHERERARSVSHVSAHNLAVLAHARALDLEAAALLRPLTAAEEEELHETWAAAFRRWGRLVEEEGFWARLRRRIEHLRDARLQTGAARRIQRGLPLALYLVNARLLLGAAERGDDRAVARQRALMEGAGLGDDAALAALEMAVAPAREQLRAVCEGAECEKDVSPESGADAGDAVLTRGEPLLALLDEALPESHPTREVAHDDVASCVLHCQVAYGRATDDWDRSLALLERALPVATAGSPARERLEENLRVVRDNVEFDRLQSTCWLCQENRADGESAMEVDLFGDVERTDIGYAIKTSYRHTKIDIPVCYNCSSKRRSYRTAAGWVSVLITPVLIYSVTLFFDPAARNYNSEFQLQMLTLIVSIAVLSVLVLWYLGANRSRASKYPPVRELLSRGWQYGKEPVPG